MEPLDMDSSKKSEGSKSRIRGRGLHLRPVSPESSGEGLPYAPENWPNPGDKWRWKVGRRVVVQGHFHDRYLYPPKNSVHKKCAFKSKLSVEKHFRTEFPAADVDAFFASFSWKVPAKKASVSEGKAQKCSSFQVPTKDMAEHAATDSESDTSSCKVGNKTCYSVMQLENGSVPAMPCDICCGEPRFCRDCCCILCAKTVSSTHGGYSYVRCEARVGEGYICGHVCHIKCALRCYMAGTVGGSIGLDAEYYCRRCDSKMDLVLHVANLLQTCESIDSRNKVEKILDLGLRMVRGSKKESAKALLNDIEMALRKLQGGASLEDIWKQEDEFSVIPADASHLESQNCGNSFDDGISENILSISSDYNAECRKLEVGVYQALQALRKAQEMEYKLAEESLNVQKNYLSNLYQQLDKERSELAAGGPTNTDILLSAILNRVDQIKREALKLRDMKKVANGFGRTSKRILKDHFGLKTDD